MSSQGSSPVPPPVVPPAPVLAPGPHQPNGGSNFQHKYLQVNLTVDNARISHTSGLLKPNPYTEVIVDGKPPKKTDTCKSSYHPKWQCDLTLVVTPYSKIVFRVYDHSILKKDSLLGDCSLDLYSLLKKHNGKCQNTALALDITKNNSDNGSSHIGILHIVLDGINIDIRQISGAVSTSPVMSLLRNNENWNMEIHRVSQNTWIQ